MEKNPGRALQQTRSPENKVAEDAENVQICFMLGSNWLIYTLIQPQTFGSLGCGSDLNALSKL